MYLLGTVLQSCGARIENTAFSRRSQICSQSWQFSKTRLGSRISTVKRCDCGIVQSARWRSEQMFTCSGSHVSQWTRGSLFSFGEVEMSYIYRTFCFNVDFIEGKSFIVPWKSGILSLAPALLSLKARWIIWSVFILTCPVKIQWFMNYVSERCCLLLDLLCFLEMFSQHSSAPKMLNMSDLCVLSPAQQTCDSLGWYHLQILRSEKSWSWYNGRNTPYFILQWFLKLKVLTSQEVGETILYVGTLKAWCIGLKVRPPKIIGKWINNDSRFIHRGCARLTFAKRWGIIPPVLWVWTWTACNVDDWCDRWLNCDWIVTPQEFMFLAINPLCAKHI